MKKKTLIKGIIISLIVLFLLFLLVALTNKKSSSTTNESKELKEMEYNYESRVEKLEKFDSNNIKKYGWLQVQGTNIDLPILSKLYEKEPEFNYGWLLSTSFSYDTRKILVGHNVLNVSSTPMINNPKLTNFEDLMAFSYYGFAKDNMYLVYTEYGEDKVYVIYAVGFYDYDYEYDKNGLNKNEVDKYIKYVKKNSIYDYGVDVNKDDDIITIKTCTRMFGVDEKQQFQIDARLLRKNEKILKYNVEKTKLYNEYKLSDNYKNSFS